MKTRNNDVAIGKAILEYSPNGKITKGTFQPMIEMSLDGEIIKRLRAIDCHDNEAKMKNEAETVMANWFDKVQDIELADRTKYAIVTVLKNCKKYTSGKVKCCEIKFILKKLQDATTN